MSTRLRAWWSAVRRAIGSAWAWLRVGRRRLWAGSLAVLVLAASLVWALWPTEEPPPPPRARQYLDMDVCMLTDAQGVANAPASAVWAGMQSASLETHVRAYYSQVMGPATKGNALPYLNSLVVRHCLMILAVGPAQVEAAYTNASVDPKIQFVVVGPRLPASAETEPGFPFGSPSPGPSKSSSPPTNITRIDSPSPDEVKSRVHTLVVDVVKKNQSR